MSDTLSQAADVATIVAAAWPVLTATVIGSGVLGVSGGIAAAKIIVRKERRLLTNLKRPVAVIPARQGSMEHEARLLKDVEFFNIDQLASDPRSVDLVTKHRLVVLQYDADPKSHFWKTYEQLQSRQVPVIVYAKPGEISFKTDHMERIQRYSLHTLCNTPLRLLSDVTSIMTTYPESK